MTDISGPSAVTDLAAATPRAGRRPARRGGPATAPRRTASGSAWGPVAFIAPLLVFFAVFYGYPLFRNLEMSVRDYTIRALIHGGAEFVGFQNYLDILRNPTFLLAAGNTALFVIVSLVFQYTIGLALAVFFHKNFPLSNTLRAMFLVPWLLPLIVSASTWAWMMNSDSGIFNFLLNSLGFGSVNWLTSPDMALTSVIITNIWLGIPFNLVILYSGLQNISNDVYEAASIDGAGPWRQFWSITFPLLRPVSAITLLLGIIYTLKVVDVVWIMTSGGPVNSSTTFAVWSYRLAFGGEGVPQLSSAAALGNILVVIALVFGIAHIVMQRRQEES